MAAPKKGRGKARIAGYLRLRAPAGQATPAPPIGPALGQRGLNIQEFVRQFNDQTKNAAPGTPMPVVLTIFTDKSFAMEVRTPPASHYIKTAAGLTKGSAQPGRQVAGQITLAQCHEIGEAKRADLNGRTPEARARIIMGAARAMGIDVAEEQS